MTDGSRYQKLVDADTQPISNHRDADEETGGRLQRVAGCTARPRAGSRDGGGIPQLLRPRETIVLLPDQAAPSMVGRIIYLDQNNFD